MNIKQEKQGNWFSRHKILTGIAIVIIFIIIASAASNKSTINTTASSSNSQNTSTNTPTTKPATTAKVGDTLSLKDQSDNTMDVTLVKIVDPATGADQYTTPDNGKRFVGVQFKVANTSTNVLSEVPSNDATVFDATGQSYSSTISSLSGCADFATGAKLNTSASELGCVAFQVPIGTKITKVQFTPSSSFSNSTGEWVVQ